MCRRPSSLQPQLSRVSLGYLWCTDREGSMRIISKMDATGDDVKFEWPNVQERTANFYVETQSRQETDEQTYDEITGNPSTNQMYNSHGDCTSGNGDRRKDLETESVKNAVIIPRKILVFLVVVVFFSFLVSAALLVLELKPMLIPNVSNAASTEGKISHADCLHTKSISMSI